MKKIVFLTVLSLLGCFAMSCDSDSVDSNGHATYGSDDGFTPVTPPPPPPPPPPPGGGYTKP